MIPHETVEAILQAAHIEEVVGDFVTLKKRGANLIGHCPFHNEKTPSFNVNPARNIFKCFGCGKAGDSAKFLMEHEHYTYVEALRYLAKKYNIQIEEKEQTPEELLEQSEREKMYNVNGFASNFFIETLWHSEEGQSVGLQYFRERGFLDPIIEKFQLGYSPTAKDAFATHARKNGYDDDLLVKIGLCIHSEKGNYDRFHSRVIFPIHSMTGRVIGFGGRILGSDPEKKLAKYQNSPQSEIYDKSHTLYGIYFAKNAIVRQDSCILVEGYFDVLHMHQIGMENVVASSGTSLTMEQIRLVKRYTNNITMLYDGDDAGLHAALRGTDMILSEGMNVRVVVLPPEHDPATFAKTFPIEKVQGYLADNAKDFIRFKTELLLKDAADDPIKRSEVIRDIVQTISVIPDSIFRISYIKECSRLLDMPETTLMAALNKMLRARFKKSLGPDGDAMPDENIVAPNQEEEHLDEQIAPGFFQERELVKMLLMYGTSMIAIETTDEEGKPVEDSISVAQLIIDDLKQDEIQFNDSTNNKIFNIFDHEIDEGNIPNDQFFISNEDDAIANLAADLLTSPYKLDRWEKHGIFVKTEQDVLKQAVMSAIYRYKDQVIDARLRAVAESLKQETDPDNQLILLKQKKDLDGVRMKINHLLGIVIAK